MPHTTIRILSLPNSGRYAGCTSAFAAGHVHFQHSFFPLLGSTLPVKGCVPSITLDRSWNRKAETNKITRCVATSGRSITPVP